MRSALQSEREMMFLWLVQFNSIQFFSFIFHQTMQRFIISGSGIAGTSVAMQLYRKAAKQNREIEVVCVEPRGVLGATSQNSSECYRNFFVDDQVIPFMERSMEIIEEADRSFGLNMNNKGYCFLAGSKEGGKTLTDMATISSSFGAGEVRYHCTEDTYTRSPLKGIDKSLDGFDIITSPDVIQRVFPGVNPEASTLVHCRKAGWLDARGLGSYYYQEAKSKGMKLTSGSVSGFDIKNNEIKKVMVTDDNGHTNELECDVFINCSGAWVPWLNNLMNAPELPLKNEIIAKVVMNDSAGIVCQQTTPFMVWRDRTNVDWSPEMVEALEEIDDTQEGGILNTSEWLKTQPGGQHIRPLGNGRILVMWEHVHAHIDPGVHPEFPITQLNEFYHELAIAGATKIIPALGVYRENMTKDMNVDAGYYNSSTDGRPIIGWHGPSNNYVIGGLSGWGIMSSAAAGDLAATDILGGDLPSYAGGFCYPRLNPLTRPPVNLLDPRDESADIVDVV